MKILVVEDEPLIRLGMVAMLEDAGYDAFEAPHADAAIVKLDADKDIRLVITDVDMPGTMDGVKLAHYIRNRWPPIQIIVVSGKVGLASDALPSGARFFSKPYEERLVLAALAELGAADPSQPSL